MFEQVRYDALGRRVSVRADRECLLVNNLGLDRLNCDLSTLQRTVWDGDRELVELQVPIKVPTRSAEPDSVVDNDLFLPTYPRVLNNQDPNPFFGRLVYTYGLTLDQPLALTRYHYVDFFQGSASRVNFPPTTVTLMWTALGTVNAVACADGKAECTATNGVRTANLQLGLPNLWFTYERPKFLPSAFSGTLLSDKQTATGTHYRRNRYYDPGAGRFTQEDPIGFAGGMNLYGFAGSDPVNFADPFGLCPVCLIAWGAYELGSGIYDVYQAAKTIADPRASRGQKAASVGFAAASLLLPGGGYSALDDLADAGKAVVKSGNLTAAGHALDKHSRRIGNVFPAAGGSVAAKNAAGQHVLEDILTAPGSIRVPTAGGRFKGSAFDIYAPDGRGVRFRNNGEFIGFLQPPRP